MIRKAGYKGKLETILNKIKLTRYESSLERLDFKDYSKLKESNKWSITKNYNNMTINIFNKLFIYIS